MVKRNEIFAAVLLAVFASSAIAADKQTRGTLIAEYADAVDKKADAIVVYTPMAHHALDKMESVDRVLSGRVEKQEKGDTMPTVIVHRANTMTMPLEAGKPVKMFLRRFSDRDAYYPIAIFSVSSGVK